MKIAKKIPIPSTGSGRPRSKYKFELLKEIGDSFFVEGAKGKHSVYSSLASYNRKSTEPISITIRSEDNGIRVWRIQSNKKKK